MSSSDTPAAANVRSAPLRSDLCSSARFWARNAAKMLRPLVPAKRFPSPTILRWADTAGLHSGGTRVCTVYGPRNSTPLPRRKVIDIAPESSRRTSGPRSCRMQPVRAADSQANRIAIGVALGHPARTARITSSSTAGCGCPPISSAAWRRQFRIAWSQIGDPARMTGMCWAYSGKHFRAPCNVANRVVAVDQRHRRAWRTRFKPSTSAVANGAFLRSA